MCDRETVGGLQVVNIVIEVEGLLRRILVGIIQLDSKPEGAVLLHCRAHEQPTYRRANVTYIGTLISSFLTHMESIIPLITIRFMYRVRTAAINYLGTLHR